MVRLFPEWPLPAGSGSLPGSRDNCGRVLAPYVLNYDPVPLYPRASTFRPIPDGFGENGNRAGTQHRDKGDPEVLCFGICTRDRRPFPIEVRNQFGILVQLVQQLLGLIACCRIIEVREGEPYLRLICHDDPSWRSRNMPMSTLSCPAFCSVATTRWSGHRIGELSLNRARIKLHSSVRFRPDPVIE